MDQKEQKDKISPKKDDASLHVAVLKQMLTLATSGFGLVAALAWNSLIQEFVNSYVKKWLPQSGLVSLLIYALLITTIAVIVTYQLSKVIKRVEGLQNSNVSK